MRCQAAYLPANGTVDEVVRHMATLFRERAVASRAATEVTDRPLRVVSAPAWAALGLALILLTLLGVWMFAGTVALTTRGQAVINNDPANIAVRAPTDGELVEASPAVGSKVTAGQTIAVISIRGAVGDQSTVAEVVAPISGTVVAPGPGAGSAVAFGSNLATIAPDSSTQVGYLFLPVAPTQDIAVGSPVLFNVEGIATTENGLLEGQVSSVSPLPVDRDRVAYITASEERASEITKNGPVVEVQVALTTDPATPSGLRWTLPPGPTARVVSGTPAEATLILSEVRPYQAFLGSQ